MSKVLERLRREPIVSRVGLAAVLNVLVVSGVLDTQAAGAVEAAVLATANALLILGARKRVTADTDLVRRAARRRRMGL
jgi:hypothetical protein